MELLWDSSSEAMVWSTDGVPRQGLTGESNERCAQQPVTSSRRIEYTLSKKAKGGETIDLFIEMACNGMFGAGENDIINPPDENRQFRLALGNYLVQTVASMLVIMYGELIEYHLVNWMI